MADARVTIIGTSHNFQVQGDMMNAEEVSVSSEFQIFLRNICTTKKIGLIGEELSLDEESLKKGRESIARLVANECGIQHCYCDPTLEQRRSLGIDQAKLENIYVECAHAVLMENVARTNEEEAIEVQRKYHAHPEIARADAIREGAWLREIAKFNAADIVFVCGAFHVESFAALLKSQGHKVTIEVEDWVPR